MKSLSKLSEIIKILNLEHQNSVERCSTTPPTSTYHHFPAEGTDYNIAGGLAEDVNGFPVVLTLTLQIGATQACFDVDIVDDAVFDGESDRAVEQVTFSYSGSSPTVARVNLRHTLVILDNDRKIYTQAKICILAV